MDDDGLLLNFTTSASPAPLSSKQLAALQGKKPKGSWRERREAKRLAAPRDEPLPAFPRPQARPAAAARPAAGGSRPLHGGVSKPARGGSGSGSGGGGSSGAAAAAPPPKDGIVSSLFTYNPQIVPTRGERHAGAAGEATNAPLAQDSNAFAVNDKLAALLKDKLLLHAPTQIQKEALPAIAGAAAGGAARRDVVMVAQTGSGKTLAYLLPIINDLMTAGERIDRASGVYAVILAPTRELASQIFQVCEELCRCCHYIVPGLVIGGEKKKSEKARLRKGVNLLIGTPGRMADHVENTARLSLRKVRYAVLDEGDRLIDLGFEETLTRILAAIPQTRTTILCSATMNAQAARLKTLALSDPIEWVREKRGETASGSRSAGKAASGDAPMLGSDVAAAAATSATGAPAAHLENTPGQLVQRVAVVPGKLRLVTLAATIRYMCARAKRGIVFFSCTDSVDFHFEVFSRTAAADNLKVFRLHGGMSQQQRTETIARFASSAQGAAEGGRARGASVLLTTDVASRGLDVTVDEVVEFDPPFTVEDHLHRAGRTARAGRKGEAVIFLLPSEQAYEAKLSSVHSGDLRSETYQSLLQRGFGFAAWQDDATAWQLALEKAVLANTDGIADLARKAFTAHTRAYTTHSHAEKSIFNFRELHLGHLAKAFALRETPGTISAGRGGGGGGGGAAGGSSGGKTQHKKKSPKQAMIEAAQRQLETGEYNIA